MVPGAADGYGGIELVVSLLADGLVDAGHDVTLFASGGSQTKAKLDLADGRAARPARARQRLVRRLPRALARTCRSDGFDVVHDHAGIVGPICGAMLRGTPPVVHTLHGPWTPQTRLFYSLVGHHVHLVAISDAQRADNPDVPYIGTVHNGIDLDVVPVPRGEGRRPRLHRALESRQGTEGGDRRSRAAPACRCR